MSQTISPLSAAAHYLAGMQMWEARAKSLQALVDAQDAEITRLREQLAVYEPPEPDTEQQAQPAAE
ncbi:hypothetical protein [Pelagibacterium sp. H642]|uniref:hypothetical protein n=1 Tax=Pelagibacterium sp. H642 TaxID=1881069 RepID=UPI002814C1D0|nr:hypothetical protein [Pelagibacterium sp. H642]WMT90170.1 hypothetical protein NO934_15435 [Pelagibacterium sp. H642]